MAILSVDLACRHWSDLGIVILDRVPSQTSGLLPAAHSPARGLQALSTQASSTVECLILPSSADGLPEGPVDAEILAGRLNHLCTANNIRVLMLDGPQAWKSGSNGLEHARLSERALNTAAKTGLPGLVKPSTYRTFSEFCIDVYDALARRGWQRLDTSAGIAPQQRILVESYPYAAWRSLGIVPLPAKRRAQISDLARAYADLHNIVPFTTNRPPNHDQLQAIVGGLPGLALEERNNAALRIVGAPPRREQGHWREGFIVLPVPPPHTAGLRWLN
ncbi:MAG: hypothetical protein P4K83_03850 [Terracidiphilus sp.]|nr:hypothetical protein [Terracidiphilus sp.]